MKYALVAMAAMSLSAALHAAIPTYEGRSQRVLLSGQDLANGCQVLNESYKVCSWQASYKVPHNVILTIAPEQRQSLGTRLLLKGKFTDTDGQFSLVVDGIKHHIDDISTTQSFKVPEQGPGTLKVEIASSYAGEGDVLRDYASYVESLVLILDNGAVIQDVMKQSSALMEQANDRLTLYKKEKRLLNYLSVSEETLKEIKEVETGRTPDDLTDDCQVDGSGNPHLLDPQQCQILIHINRILRHEPVDVDANTLAAARSALEATLAELEKALTYLQAAQLDLQQDFSERISQIKASLEKGRIL